MDIGPLDGIVDWLFGILDPVFSQRYVAPVIILPAMLIVAAFLIVHAGSRARPFFRAADRRIKALVAGVGSSGDPEGERMAFAAAFPDVDAALSQRGRGAGALIRSWNEFRESLLDEGAAPIRNTSRPQNFFNRAIPSVGHLSFWSNVFVGVGLLLTFIGIVVALNTAGAGMEGGTQEDTQLALQELLAIAGAKFFASIAGLLCSIILRFADAHYQRKIRGKIDRIAGLLDRGLLFVTPQLLAAQQLDELRKQSGELERFRTDVAEAIGGRFESAMTPMAGTLSELSARLSEFTDRIGEGLGRGAASAVTAAASGELRALGQTLGGIGGELDKVGRTVNGSGEEAARQIRAAGEDFAKAAHDIREAFAGLSGDIDGVGKALIERSEATAAAQSSRLEAALAAFNAGQVDAADALSDAVRQLGDAGEEGARAVQANVAETLRLVLTESQAMLRATIAEAGVEFSRAGGELAAAVRASVDRIDDLAASIERSQLGADATATAFLGTAQGASSAAEAIAAAAAGFAAAASPVVESSRALAAASGRVAEAAADQTREGHEALAGLRTLAAGIQETQAAAAAAWNDYRSRFEGVDQNLAGTLDGMSRALGEAMQQLRDFAAKLDGELATAVTRLASPLDTIQENSEAILEYAEAIKVKRPEAAE